VQMPKVSLAKAMTLLVVIAVMLMALRDTSVAGPRRWSRIPISEDSAFKRDVWKSQMWASATFTLTVGVLCLTTVGIILGRGPKRTSWTAFAVIGWGCLTLAFGPILQVVAIPQSVVSLLLRPMTESDIFVWAFVKTASIPLDFAQVAFSLLSLIAGFLGSVIAASVFATRQNIPPALSRR
jgi:hypothetical protein